MPKGKSHRRKPPATKVKTRKRIGTSTRGSRHATASSLPDTYRHFDLKEGIARLPNNLGDPSRWHREQAALHPGMKTWVGVILGDATSLRGTVRAAALRYGLTDREADIAAEMAEGYTNREISVAMHISFHTVRAHVRNIFKKLGASSRMEVVNKLKTEPS